MEYMVIAIKIIFEVIIIVATLLIIIYNHRIAKSYSQINYKYNKLFVLSITNIEILRVLTILSAFLLFALFTYINLYG